MVLELDRHSTNTLEESLGLFVLSGVPNHVKETIFLSGSLMPKSIILAGSSG